MRYLLRLLLVAALLGGVFGGIFYWKHLAAQRTAAQQSAPQPPATVAISRKVALATPPPIAPATPME